MGAKRKPVLQGLFLGRHQRGKSAANKEDRLHLGCGGSAPGATLDSAGRASEGRNLAGDFSEEVRISERRQNLNANSVQSRLQQISSEDEVPKKYWGRKGSVRTAISRAVDT